MASYGYTFNSGDGVTPTRLNDARTVSDIVNADIKSDAAIAGTKIAPDFGSQNVVTTGRTLLGASGNSNAFNGITPTLLAEGVTDYNKATIGVVHNRSDANAGFIVFGKTRATTSGGLTAAQSGDSLGSIVWHGSDGAGMIRAASILAAVDGTPGTNDMPGRLIFSTTADGGSSPAERMRLDSDGYLNIASATPISPSVTTDTGVTLGSLGIFASRSANPCLQIQRSTSNGSVAAFYRDTTSVGSISVTTTATAYNTSSDYRLKENATPLISGLATIAQLQPCEFTWKSDGSIGRGFIAHELQAVVPEAVTGEKDAVDAEGNPQYQGVDASKIVPLLVAAVQELSAKVAALEAAQ